VPVKLLGDTYGCAPFQHKQPKKEIPKWMINSTVIRQPVTAKARGAARMKEAVASKAAEAKDKVADFGRKAADLAQTCPQWNSYLSSKRPSMTLCGVAASFLSRRGKDMETVLIVLVVLFLLGGGGWGYSRWRG
jgi:hypothetical protein